MHHFPAANAFPLQGLGHFKLGKSGFLQFLSGEIMTLGIFRDRS